MAQYLPEFAAVKVQSDDGTLVDPMRPPSIGDLRAHTSGLTYDFLIDTPVAELYREHRIMNDATRTLAECIEASVRRWRFPASSEGGPAKFPIVFSAN